MDTRIKGASPKIDTKLYEDQKADLTTAIELAKANIGKAKVMLNDMEQKLDKDRTNIAVQEQVLKLRDYIFKYGSLLSQLEGQLYECQRVLDGVNDNIVQ